MNIRRVERRSESTNGKNHFFFFCGLLVSIAGDQVHSKKQEEKPKIYSAEEEEKDGSFLHLGGLGLGGGGYGEVRLER